MWPSERAYSNPVYDLVDSTNAASFTRPLMINIEPNVPHSYTNTHQIPLLLLASCFASPPSSSRHNYVNQRLEEENLDPLYARPRKRCVTLEDDPVIVPAKTSRYSMKAVEAELVSTTLPVATVLLSNQSTDEIDQFIARENERVERVKLRRRQHQFPAAAAAATKAPPAFSNPNYVDMPVLKESEETDLSQSVLV